MNSTGRDQPAIRIRKATKEDVPLILKFIKAIAAYEKLADQVTATEETLTQSLFGNQPAAEVSFACIDDQAVGYAVYFHNFSTFEGKRGLYVEDIFIKPAFRGKGIGKTMLKHLTQMATDRQCARFEWVVLDWNINAINFYKKIGAQVFEEWRVCRMERPAIEQFCSKDF
jgi:GNAT superfamily N-acetyltransferase